MLPTNSIHCFSGWPLGQSGCVRVCLHNKRDQVSNTMYVLKCDLMRSFIWVLETVPGNTLIITLRPSLNWCCSTSSHSSIYSKHTTWSTCRMHLSLTLIKDFWMIKASNGSNRRLRWTHLVWNQEPTQTACLIQSKRLSCTHVVYYLTHTAIIVQTSQMNSRYHLECPNSWYYWKQNTELRSSYRAAAGANAAPVPQRLVERDNKHTLWHTRPLSFTHT